MFSNWALIWQDQATVESSTCPSCIFGKLVQSTSNVKPAYQRKINKPNQEHICGTTRPRQMESKLSRRYQPWTRHDLICPISKNDKLWWSSRIKLKAGRTGWSIPLKINFYNAITMHQPLVIPRRTLQLC